MRYSLVGNSLTIHHHLERAGVFLSKKVSATGTIIESELVVVKGLVGNRDLVVGKRLVVDRDLVVDNGLVVNRDLVVSGAGSTESHWCENLCLCAQGRRLARTLLLVGLGQSHLGG